MSPLTWVTSISAPFLFSGVIYSNDIFIKVALLSVFIVCLSFYLGVYTYFMCKDPDRLQSEDYNIIKKYLSLKEKIIREKELTQEQHPCGQDP